MCLSDPFPNIQTVNLENVTYIGDILTCEFMAAGTSYGSLLSRKIEKSRISLFVRELHYFP